MPSQGPSDPGTLTNTGSGFSPWSNPGNAETSDNLYAQVALDNGTTSEYLTGSDLGFSIPAGVTIDGILVEIERHSGGAGDITDQEVKLLIAGTPSGSNKATGTPWATSDPGTYVSYGGAADLWGLTPTASDINNSGFGVVLSAASAADGLLASVDHIRITVYYHTVHQAAGNAEAVSSSTAILSQTHAAAGNAEAITTSTSTLGIVYQAAGNAEAVTTAAAILSQTHAASGNAEAVTSSTSRLYTGSATGCVHVTLEPEWDVSITLEPQWEVAIAIAPRWAVAITFELC